MVIMKNQKTIVLRKKNMKCTALSLLGVLLSVFCLPLSVNASPFLPAYAQYKFTGSFTWDNGGPTQDIAGIINFNLDFQIDKPTTYLDYVCWSYNLETYDGLLSISSGFFENEEAACYIAGGDPSFDPSELSWGGGYWDAMTHDYTDYYSGIDWDDSWDFLSGDSWNLITNENFLPSTIHMEIIDWSNSCYGQIDINLYPVPEPATLLLFGVGLSTILTGSWLRKKREGYFGKDQ